MAAHERSLVVVLFILLVYCFQGTQAAEEDTGTHGAENIQASGIQKELNDLLAWSIENSNVSELQRQAQASRVHQDQKDMAARKAEIQALISEMDKEPSGKQLMEEAMALAQNMSAPTESRIDALTALRYLLEPIDNAMDLPKLGGIQLLASILRLEENPGLLAAAAFVLGTAASNNPTVQAAALSEPTLMPSLLKHAKPGSGEASEKALYAVSALISSNHEGQHQFRQGSGVTVIQRLLASDLNTRQLRKVLNLITDLTDIDDLALEDQEHFANKEILRPLMSLMEHPDHDIQERALLALITQAGKPEGRRILLHLAAKKAAAKARHRCEELLRDADEDYREILEHLMVLCTDFEDILGRPVSDRTEL